MEEVSLGFAVVGVFESVNWNLRALAERKEPIAEPQPVLGGGLKLVSVEGDNNESELVLVKENGCGGFCLGRQQVLRFDNPLPPSRLLIPRQEACSYVAFYSESRRSRRKREYVDPIFL